MTWDDDPPPRAWISATPAHIDRASMASPPIECVDDVDPEGDREAEQLAMLDELAADHLATSDRLLYHQCLRAGLPVAQIAPGVGLTVRKARERLVEITRRLRILAAAPELPSLIDSLTALASHAHAQDVHAAWLHCAFRSGRSIARRLSLSPQRASEAIRRGLAAIEEQAASIAEADQLGARAAYRLSSGWTAAALPRSQGRARFERTLIDEVAA